MSPKYRLKLRTIKPAILLILIVNLAACATLEIQVEQTPTPDQSALATLSALMFQVTQKAEQVSRLSQQSPTPAPLLFGTSQPESSFVPDNRLAGLIFQDQQGKIWRVDQAGQPVKASDAQFNEVAVITGADDLKVIYAHPGGDLWLDDLDNTQAQNLTNTPDRVDYSPVFWKENPDILIFMSQPANDIGPTAGYLSSVSISKGDYRLLEAKQSSIGQPAPGPDGKTIAYDQAGDDWLYVWGQGPQAMNLDEYGLDVPKNIRAGSPAWSPDGKMLAWVVGGNFGPSGNWRVGIALLDLEKKTSRLLHLYEPVGRGGWFDPPIWSPDGRWLAFIQESFDEQGGLWVLRVDGVQENEIHLGGNYPLWDLDGSLLVYIKNTAAPEAWMAESETWQEERLVGLSMKIPLAWELPVQ